MEEFMKKISSIYKHKVTKESFKSIADSVDANVVLKKLLEKHLEK